MVFLLSQSKILAIKTFFQYSSSEVAIGNKCIGGNRPVLVQSMTNTDTLDTISTVEQVIRLADAGCDIVRITAPGIKEAENLAKIKDKLIKKGYELPLIADIHFNPKAADVAAQIVEKVRINPGNYIDRNRGKTDWTTREIRDAQERISERLYPLIEICKKHKTAIRIGTNHGSLSERILSMYGNTPEGMVESAMEFVRIVRAMGFHNLVLSMKASNYRNMTRANLLLVEKMILEGFYYPIHLGVTEAGNGEEARIKSAAGIGSLLTLGIGDTIRVSLAEMPVHEGPFGKKLVNYCGRNSDRYSQVLGSTSFLKVESEKPFKTITGHRNPVVSQHLTGADFYTDSQKKVLRSGKYPASEYKFHEVLSSETDEQEAKNLLFKRRYSNQDEEDLLLESAVDFGTLFINRNTGGIWLDLSNNPSKQEKELSLKILQGLGLRYSKAEFIACPSCGRTKFNLFESFNKVKTRTAHLKGLKIAVMGCIVNGPGEMADADYGYVGAGPGKVTLYKNGIPVHKNLDEEIAVEELIRLIRQSGDWSQSK